MWFINSVSLKMYAIGFGIFGFKTFQIYLMSGLLVQYTFES